MGMALGCREGWLEGWLVGPVGKGVGAAVGAADGSTVKVISHPQPTELTPQLLSFHSLVPRITSTQSSPRLLLGSPSSQFLYEELQVPDQTNESSLAISLSPVQKVSIESAKLFVINKLVAALSTQSICAPIFAQYV